MKGYAGHIIMYVNIKNENQTSVSVWDNIVLVRADSEEQAFLKAELHGKSEEGDDGGSFRWGGKPAEWVFAGVRKLTTLDEDVTTEAETLKVSFIEYEAASIEDVKALAAGEPVRLLLNDRFRSQVSESASTQG